MKRTLLIICIGILIATFAGCNAGEKKKEQNSTSVKSTTTTPSGATIKIAAFNIQVFGKSKREKPEVMDVLTRTAREFDVFLVQEIRDASETTAQTYLDAINDMAGPDYAFVKSERLGRSSSKEAYAYFYNTATVEFIDGSGYVHDDMADGEDEFEREPYVASFKSGNFDFTLAGIHIKPDDADAEIGELTEVYLDILAKNPDESDVILMGDFNADGSYFDEDGANTFRDGYHWIITNDMDTMVKTDWTYDRMVMKDSTVSHEYVEDSAAVFYFDQEYEIDDQELVEDVSDHFPVYAVFRTGLADDD